MSQARRLAAILATGVPVIRERAYCGMDARSGSPPAVRSRSRERQVSARNAAFGVAGVNRRMGWKPAFRWIAVCQFAAVPERASISRSL